MASAEVREAIAERSETMKREKDELEKQFVRGRHTDNNALHNLRCVASKVQRRAPKRLAQMDLMKIEAADTGIQTEDGEVVDRVTQKIFDLR